MFIYDTISKSPSPVTRLTASIVVEGDEVVIAPQSDGESVD
jgi:hypothetical protein